MKKNSTKKSTGISVFYERIKKSIKPALVMAGLCSVAAGFGQQLMITSVSPQAATAGSTVKITATKVDPTASNNIVYFGAAKATVSSVSGTTLDVIVPTGATYAPVTLTQGGTTAVSGQKFDLTFQGSAPVTAGTFSTPITFNADSGVRCTYLQPADIDGDNRVDIVSVGYYANVGETIKAGDLSIFKNGSTLDSISLKYTPIFHFDFNAKLNVADVDADGKPDIIVSSDNGKGTDLFMVFRNLSTPGKLAFAAKKTFQLPSYGNIKLGDVDLDGKPDVIFYTTDSLYVLKNSSRGTVINFAAPLNVNVQGGRGVEITDFNNDNIPDLAIYNAREKTVFAYRNHSKRGLISFGFDSYLTTDSYYSLLASGDMNGDGLADIAATDIYSGTNLHIIKNAGTKLGDIDVQLAATYQRQLFSSAIAMADINGDGKPDVLATTEQFLLSVYENASTLSTFQFNPKVDFPTTKYTRDVIAVDLNGDGKPDVITSQNPGSHLLVFKNQQTKATNTPVVTSFDPSGGGLKDTIVIKGKNFTGVSNVKFGGVDALQFTFLSDTSVAAVVGSGATGDISVISGAGTGSKSGFTYLLEPRISIYTDSTSICDGSLVTIQAIAEKRYPSYQYSWYKNGVKIGEYNKPFVSTKLMNGDSVWAVMVNIGPVGAFSAKSNVLHFTVAPAIKPTIVVSSDKRNPICKGTSVTFTAKITNGGSLPVYRWMKNQAQVGTNNPIYTDANLQDGDSIYCVLTVTERCAITPVSSKPIVLEITNGVPAAPVAINGPSTVGVGETGVVFSVAPVNGASSYNWLLPAGAAVTAGKGTESITVSWGKAGGNVSAAAVNICGTSNAAIKPVTIGSSSARIINKQNAVAGDDIAKNQPVAFNVYPNPANSKITVSFSGEPAGKYAVQLADANGKVLQSQKVQLERGVSNTSWNVAGYAPGVYHVTLLNNNKFVNSKQLLIGQK